MVFYSFRPANHQERVAFHHDATALCGCWLAASQRFCKWGSPGLIWLAQKNLVTYTDGEMRHDCTWHDTICKSLNGVVARAWRAAERGAKLVSDNLVCFFSGCASFLPPSIQRWESWLEVPLSSLTVLHVLPPTTSSNGDIQSSALQQSSTATLWHLWSSEVGAKPPSVGPSQADTPPLVFS